MDSFSFHEMEVLITRTFNRQLYQLMTACSGNWRNTLYIASQRPDHPGYLLAFDRDGRPVLMAVEQLRQVSGEYLDPAECCGNLTEESFKSLFTQYLLWQTSFTLDQPLELLSS